MTIPKALREGDWEEPYDDSIVSVPNGWHGGSVWHTGGNIWMRSWRNVEERPTSESDVDEYLEVGYNGDFLGASVSRYVKDDDGRFYHEEVVDEIEVTDGNDRKCAEAAVKLMKRHR